MKEDIEFMRIAIQQASEGVKNGHGGPFGCCVVRNDSVVSACHNTVIRDNDPTAHAEMNAIREACRIEQSFILRDCTIYTTGEPCSMCLGAIYWARIPRIVAGISKEVIATYGFDDNNFYEDIKNYMQSEFFYFTFCKEVIKECTDVCDTWVEMKGNFY